MFWAYVIIYCEIVLPLLKPFRDGPLRNLPRYNKQKITDNMLGISYNLNKAAEL